jgi:hypothetical protein
VAREGQCPLLSTHKAPNGTLWERVRSPRQMARDLDRVDLQRLRRGFKNRALEGSASDWPEGRTSTFPGPLPAWPEGSAFRFPCGPVPALSEDAAFPVPWSAFIRAEDQIPASRWSASGLARRLGFPLPWPGSGVARRRCFPRPCKPASNCPEGRSCSNLLPHRGCHSWTGPPISGQTVKSFDPVWYFLLYASSPSYPASWLSAYISRMNLF